MKRLSVPSALATGITIGAVLLSGPAGAQTADASASPSFEMKAVRAAKPPLIDGDVGDDEWVGATTDMGLPDWFGNYLSMPGMYIFAVEREALRTVKDIVRQWRRSRPSAPGAPLCP